MSIATLAALAGALAVSFQARDTINEDPRQAALAWIQDNAIPMTLDASGAVNPNDVDRLVDRFGPAPIIGLGEGTHGTAEFYRFKDAVIRRLHERGDLDAVLWEVDVPTVARIEAMLNHDPDGALELMRGFNWRTEEIRAHFHWLSSLQEDQRPGVKGFDIFAIAQGYLDGMHHALDEGGAKAEALDRAITELLGLDGPSSQQNAETIQAAISGLNRSEYRVLAALLETLPPVLSARDAPIEIELGALASAQRAYHLLQFFSLLPDVPDQPAGAVFSAYSSMRAETAASAQRLLAHTPQPILSTAAIELLEALSEPRAFQALWFDASRAERGRWQDTAATLHARLEARLRLGLADTERAVSDAAQVLSYLDFVHAMARTVSESELLNRREEAMADNIQALRDHYGQNARLVVWAHNFHINRASGPEGRSSGTVLARNLGHDYLSVATLFGQGGFQARDAGPAARDGSEIRSFSTSPPPLESLEGLLSELPFPAYAVDLRDLPEDSLAADWFAEQRPARWIGNRYDQTAADNFFHIMSASEQYDILVFFQTTRRAQPTRGARESFSFELD
jgi:erythromycin esterase-like protein